MSECGSLYLFTVWVSTTSSRNKDNTHFHSWFFNGIGKIPVKVEESNCGKSLTKHSAIIGSE